MGQLLSPGVEIEHPAGIVLRDLAADIGLAKVLAVGKNNPRYTNVWNYTDMYPHLLKEITHFFSIYKDLEGKRVEMKGWHDAGYARDRVAYAMNQFKDAKSKKEAGAKA